MQENKQQLGQFYTKNATYILQDFIEKIPQGKKIIDPFCGEWDLLNAVPDTFEKIGYDISPKNKKTIEQDTLNTPPKYNKDNWLITNPPYLAKNKSLDKKIFNKYKVEDLYLASLKSIKGVSGGIIILPVGFLTNSNVKERVDFLTQYEIEKIYIFEEQVFSDTSYTVCSFLFKEGNGLNKDIEVVFMPSGEKTNIIFNEENNFTFGGEIFKKKQTKIKISRLLIGEVPNSNIKLYAIDSGSKTGNIKLSYEEPFFGKSTDRAFATISFSKNFTEEEQKKIIDEFNYFLNENRLKYHSMFLTNYRNSTLNGARKRIGFEQTYSLIDNIIFKLKIC